MCDTSWTGDIHLESQPTKSGILVPVLCVNTTRTLLCSLYDPIAEGRKTAEHLDIAPVMIFSFSSGGFHILPFLENPTVKKILIIDPDFPGLNECSTKERNTVLSNPKTHAIKLPFTNDYRKLLLDFLSQVINPHMDKSFCFFPFPSAPFQDFHHQIKTIWDGFKAGLETDFATQSEFGRLWMHNALKNLTATPNCSLEMVLNKPWIIAAAGPSLETHLDSIAQKMNEGWILAATDTALPALIGYGIKPHLAVSLDAQNFTLSHFAGLKTDGIILASDFFSPHCLIQRFPLHVLFFNKHPLCSHLESLGVYYPHWDTSGGNVTHSACHLALMCKAPAIEVYGADFCFINGKSHSKGTAYITKTLISATRFLPSETLSLHFVFRSGTTKDRQKSSYENPIFQIYQEQFQRAFKAIKKEKIWKIAATRIEKRISSSSYLSNPYDLMKKIKLDILQKNSEAALQPFRAWQNKKSKSGDSDLIFLIDSLCPKNVQ